jgi:hypothetical protein
LMFVLFIGLMVKKVSSARWTLKKLGGINE